MSPNSFTAQGSVTGAPASGMTLANLRAAVRRVLASTDDWPDATLSAWLQEAIRAYSADLPRALRVTLTLATGTQSYALPADLFAVTGVEYPAGENPPERVFLVNEVSARFVAGGPYYALRGVVESGNLLTAPHTTEIVFSEDVATGETAVVSYQGVHTVPYQDGEYTSVPAAHIEALVAFCQFRAAVELQHDASWMECIANDKLGLLAEPARLAWERWRAIMDRLRGSGQSGWLSWGDMGL